MDSPDRTRKTKPRRSLGPWVAFVVFGGAFALVGFALDLTLLIVLGGIAGIVGAHGIMDVVHTMSEPEDEGGESMNKPTISISLEKAHIRGDDCERLPLSTLDEDRYCDLHAELRIEVGGRVLPRMGYSGPDDVCINEWTRELHLAVETLRQGATATHTYDEGEQGQPAFEFRREGQVVHISIVDAVIGDGAADPDWQRVPCEWPDFERAVSSFLTHLRETIEKQARATPARLWWTRVMEDAL